MHQKSAPEYPAALFSNRHEFDQLVLIDAVAQGSTPYAGEQPLLPAATVPGAMKEPARTTKAAHAKKSAIDLPILLLPFRHLFARSTPRSVKLRVREYALIVANINKPGC
ncbi:hypothetical protein [Agrobacterium sp. NPDC090273]|uniref:hypothetical protein n=1 Tax=Agrobacterium sp. NPDC090273 TaxID=3363919 RepID=UPI00383A2423